MDKLLKGQIQEVLSLVDGLRIALLVKDALNEHLLLSVFSRTNAVLLRLLRALRRMLQQTSC